MALHQHMSGHTPGKDATTRAFREVHANEPAIVTATRRKQGARAANKQRIAIALSKARRA